MIRCVATSALRNSLRRRRAPRQSTRMEQAISRICRPRGRISRFDYIEHARRYAEQAFIRSLPASNLHPFTDLPLDSEGFHDLDTIMAGSEYSSSTFVYVDLDNGNDGTAAPYTQAQMLALGGTPTNPSTTPNAYATTAAAIAQMSDGSADCMLIKYGTSSTAAIDSTWDMSGESATARQIICGWGNPADGWWELELTGALGLGNNTQRDYLIWADGRLYQSHKDPAHGNYVDGQEDRANTLRVRFAGDVLVENMVVEYGQAQCTGDNQGDNQNICFRRCQFRDNYGATSTAQGLFATNTDYLWIEECLFDHNGWHPTIANAEAISQNHNYYIQTSNRFVTLIDCVVINGSGAAHLRCGGTMIRNFYLKEPAAQFGYSSETDPYPAATGEISFNVSLDGRNAPTGSQCRAFRFTNFDDIDVYENIAANRRDSAGNEAGFLFYLDTNPNAKNLSNASVHRNISYEWQSGSGATGFEFSDANSGVFSGMIVTQNISKQGAGTQIEIPSGQSSAFLIYNNQYHGNDSFTPGTNFAGWPSASGATGETFADPSFSAPDNDLEDYMNEVGTSPADYDDAVADFNAGCRAQRKGNWDSDYTALGVINFIRSGFDRPALAA